MYNPFYYQQRYLDFVKPKTKSKQYKVYKYKGSFENISKKSCIELLFLALFYFMGIIQTPQAKHQPLSPEMKREVRKMERYAKQIKLIATEHMETVEDVKAYIAKTTDEIADLTNTRREQIYVK